VKGGENIAFVFGGELIAAVKTKIERRGMRLHQHVGRDHFASKIEMFSFMPRIEMVP
jgi:hypothetical protein